MVNSKGRRRWFGTVRRLPSGRYPARYWGPDGVRRSADDTFATKPEAQDWLTLKEAELLEDEWVDPDAGAVLVTDYAATWIDERPGLRPKSVKNYRGLLRCQVAPYLATVTVGELTLARVVAGARSCSPLGQARSPRLRPTGSCVQSWPLPSMTG